MRWIFYLPSKFHQHVLDSDYPELHPMGGTETALIRLSSTLRNLGHEVLILTEEKDIPSAEGDLLVVVRDYSVVSRVTMPHVPLILWGHDDADQKFLEPLRSPEIAASFYSAYSKVIVPSYYAANQWAQNLYTPLSKLDVIYNAIPHEKFSPSRDFSSRQPHAYYSSTPQRGLKHLLQMWPSVSSRVDCSRLSVASSMATYNSQDNEEIIFLIEQARSIPGVEYKGALNQRDLRVLAQECRALAYPCIFPETGCIAAMEAMASGCAVVSTKLGALPETAWFNPSMSLTGNWLDAWIDQILMVLHDHRHYAKIAQHNLALSEWMGYSSIAQYWVEAARQILNHNSETWDKPLSISAHVQDSLEFKKILSLWPSIRSVTPHATLTLLSENPSVEAASTKISPDQNINFAKLSTNVLNAHDKNHFVIFMSDYSDANMISKIMQTGACIIAPAKENIRRLAWRNPLIPDVESWEKSIPDKIHQIILSQDLHTHRAAQNQAAGNLLSQFLE